MEIKYFTAIVSGMFDPSQPIRQKTYIRALKSHIPEFSVYYGHFLSHEVSFPQSPLTRPPSFSKVIKTQEKGSDVNNTGHKDSQADRLGIPALKLPPEGALSQGVKGHLC